MKLEGARILVTGGGRGLGRHLVERLVEHDATVFVIDREQGLCSQLSSDFGGRVQSACVDVSDSASVSSVLGAVLDGGFEPDVLVNNAGIIHSEPLVNMLARSDRLHSLNNWRRVLATDLDSVFLVTRLVVDQMLRQRRKGLVVSVSSIAAEGNAGQSAYSAAKAGVNALTKTWAKELGPLGLRFAAIAPGFMDTFSTRSALSEAVLTRLCNQIPLRRLGGPDAVFQALQYLIDNDYVTGTVLAVDGGITL